MSEILLKEVHHRMKNNMATLVGLFSLQSDQSKDPEVKVALSKASSLASSMLVLYDRLFQQQDVQRLAVAEYLPALASEVIGLHCGGREIGLECDVEDVSISAAQAQPLTLIVSEIVTDAVKHAFARQPSPCIRLSLARTDGMVKVVVADNGTRSGFGLELVELLAHQLQGTLARSTRGGSATTLTFPVV